MKIGHFLSVRVLLGAVTPFPVGRPYNTTRLTGTGLPGLCLRKRQARIYENTLRESAEKVVSVHSFYFDYYGINAYNRAIHTG